MANESGENLLLGKIVSPYLFRCLDYGRFFTCFVRQSWPVETGFRAVLNVTQSSHLIQTNYKFLFYTRINSDEFNAERCRPGSDLGRRFSADLNIFSRAAQLCTAVPCNSTVNMIEK